MLCVGSLFCNFKLGLLCQQIILGKNSCCFVPSCIPEAISELSLRLGLSLAKSLWGLGVLPVSPCCPRAVSTMQHMEDLWNHLLCKKTCWLYFLLVDAFTHQWYCKQKYEYNGSQLSSTCSSCPNVSHPFLPGCLSHSSQALSSGVLPAWEGLEGCLILGSWAHKDAGSPSWPQCSLGEEGREMRSVNCGLQEIVGNMEQDAKGEADWLKVGKCSKLGL